MNRHVPAESEENSEINLTPMLDVVFIMLIFFVVTASFIKDYGLQIGLPSGLPNPTNLESISVLVDVGGSFSVNGRALSKGSLAPYIRSLRAENPDAEFGVQVTPESLVNDTVAAIDAG
ncbi:MAG: biopolymer transporter ExbD, partial [Woeseiaceae bacterium]